MVMIFCSLSAFLLLLDFYLKNYTTYKIAKSTKSPYMLPIVGSTQFLFSPQGKPSNFDSKNKFELKYNLQKKKLICVPILEETLMRAIDMCKQYENGFAYWTFGIFTYLIYSADLFEVIKLNQVTTCNYFQK